MFDDDDYETDKGIDYRSGIDYYLPHSSETV